MVDAKPIMEPLHQRQIEALRKTAGIRTVYVLMDMSDFILDLATKGGRIQDFDNPSKRFRGIASRLECSNNCKLLQDHG